MAWFARCTGSTPMWSMPMIFSYAPAAPNGRPSSTTDRRVIWSEVTAIGAIPPSRASALRLDRSDDDVRRLAGEIVLDVLDGPQQAIADDFGRLPGVVRREHHARERAAGAIGQDVHPEGLGERDDAGADLAGAEDAECLAEQLGQKIAGPGAVPHLTVDARDPPGRRQHERQRVLGHGERIDAGRVAYRDPVTAGGVAVR